MYGIWIGIPHGSDGIFLKILGNDLAKYGPVPPEILNPPKKPLEIGGFSFLDIRYIFGDRGDAEFFYEIVCNIINGLYADALPAFSEIVKLPASLDVLGQGQVRQLAMCVSRMGEIFLDVGMQGMQHRP